MSRVFPQWRKELASKIVRVHCPDRLQDIDVVDLYFLSISQVSNEIKVVCSGVGVDVTLGRVLFLYWPVTDCLGPIEDELALAAVPVG